MKKKATKRYINLDAIKILAVMLMVFAMYPFKGVIGEYVACICQIGIPLLFMVAGYIYFMKEDKEEFNAIVMLLKIYLIASAAYLLLQMVLQIINGNFKEYMSSLLTSKALIDFLLFNKSPGAPTMWIIGALLYTMIIVQQARINFPKSFIRMLSIVTPMLLLVDLVAGKYSLLLFNREFEIYKLTNYLFVGIPNFVIGYLIAGNRIKLNIKASTLNIVTAVLIILNIVERFLLVKFGINGGREQYLLTTFVAIAVFVIFIKTPQTNPGIVRISKTGRYYSPLMFIIFPAVGIILNALLGSFAVYLYIRPIIIIMISYWITYFVANKIAEI